MLLGPHNAKFSQDGNIVALSLDRNGLGCRLLTKKQFIYGRFRVSSKASPGNSAGTVTTLYVSTDVNKQKNEEIDFEFIGNVAGQPYTFHTNLYAPNVGNKEVEFQPWFDPTTSFHIYTISWSSSMVV
ncbi:hypothetical protein PR202_gb24152 [Eleusine coracana subsp. coracana]|uniref:GH16 domain-containing protein n=1 Tax=Eleusine coracana subsp. coracana TaxID=191504 RepID=A0AAV5FK68_ELECO|nr:hypothetical protein PR202_gb24152 [Eleusine coracana subsp. coracana]